jgi:hypothetical protein
MLRVCSPLPNEVAQQQCLKCTDLANASQQFVVHACMLLLSCLTIT